MRNEPVTMNDFADSVREELQNDLGVLFPGIKVVVQQVDKIQGDSYLGVRIDRQDGMASPVLNLEPNFKDMKAFKPYEKVVSDILEKAETVLRDMPQITLDDLNDYSQLKDNLIMQVISVKGNEERLADMPHEQMEDMAVVYRVMMDSPYRGGEMSFLVTNSIMKSYGVTQEQLHEDATANMLPRSSFRPLFNVLADMNPSFADEPMVEPDNALYVATNDKSMYGAGVIALPDFMEEVGEIMKSNYFVLPSSIHEVLLLKDDGHTDYHDLLDMVKAINATEVQPQDRLTDNVYHYDAVERVFETAKNFSERQMEKAMGRGSVLKDLADHRHTAQEHAPRQHSVPERGGGAR